MEREQAGLTLISSSPLHASVPGSRAAEFRGLYSLCILHEEARGPLGQLSVVRAFEG